MRRKKNECCGHLKGEGEEEATRMETYINRHKEISYTAEHERKKGIEARKSCKGLLDPVS